MSDEGEWFDEVSVFRATSPRGMSPESLFVAGFVAVVTGGAGIVALRTFGWTSVGMHAVVHAVVGLGLAVIVAGRLARAAPTEVRVDPSGLDLHRDRNVRRISWAEIGTARVRTNPLSHDRQLDVLDTRGRTIVRIPESFTQFDLLVEMVNATLALKPPEVADRLRRQRARRQGLFMLLGGLGFVAVAALPLYFAPLAEEWQRRGRDAWMVLLLGAMGVVFAAAGVLNLLGRDLHFAPPFVRPFD